MEVSPETHGSNSAVTKGRQGASEHCLQERTADWTHRCDQGPAWVAVIAHHMGQENEGRPGDHPPSRDCGTWSTSQNLEAALVKGRTSLKWAEILTSPSG